MDPARARMVRDLLQRWARGRVRVLLLGEAKRGKSTVGNALLRREVLPAGVLPLTAVTTIVREGSPERVVARLRDGTIRTGEIGDLAGFVTERGNPGNRLGVHEVIVTVASPLPHGSIELIDTPGVGSVLAHNTAEADIAMQSMDVAVLVLSADPPISAAERDLLSRVHSRAARTFVVLNKIDQIDPAQWAVTEEFTRQVIAETVDDVDDVPLITVSARSAVRAAVTGDEVLWRDSGLEALATVLRRQLDRTWHEDLTASIAGDAHLLVAELIDEALIAQRSRELLAARQADRVAAFRDRLERLTNRGEDAAAAAAAHLARCQAALEDAAHCLTPLTETIRRALDERLRELPNRSPSALESAGWSAITDLVVDAVTTWRNAGAAQIAAAAADAAHRQQQQLDEAIADVRASALELLGIDLMADAPVLELPTGPGFAFDLAPAIGWNQPVTAAVRRRLPGAPGRHRVIRFLHEEAERTLGMHIGRARSNFQIQIHRIGAELRRQADASCAARRAQLLRATRAAEDAAGELAIHDCSDDRIPRLRLLASQLDKLRGTKQPPARSAAL